MRDGVPQARRAYLAEPGAEMAWAYRSCHDVGMHFRGQVVGPVSFGTSSADQRHYILRGVENHHGEIEAGYLDRTRELAWSWAQENCAGLGGVGDD